MQLLRGRRRLGTGAVALVAWSCLIGPALHLGNHRNDHTHTGAVDHGPDLGAYGHVFEWHAHGDGDLHHHAARPAGASGLRAARAQVLNELARRWAAGPAGTIDAGKPASPFGHHDGQGAADHFAQLLLDAPAFVSPAVPEASDAPATAKVADRLPGARWRTPGSARGPPRLA